MAGKKNVPAIRFAGFTDAWEQRKLSSIAEEIRRTDPNSDAPVMMITANNGFIDQADRYAFNNAGESLRKYILLEKGEMAYNHGASKLRPYGSCFALTTVETARIPFVYHCFSVGDNDPEFISLELNGARVEDQLRRIVSSGARMDGLLNISYEEYGEVELMVPSIPEQRKLAVCFRQLDTLITLHQRKLDALVKVKKSMLEKMFPKGDAKTPEVRFAGFTDAWEQRKFSELYAKSSEKNDGSVGIGKNITVATMQFKPDVRVTSDDYLRTYYTFNLGDIAFEGHQSKEFRYGRFVENDIGNGIVSHIFAVFRPIADYDLHFWKYAINNEKLMQGVLSRSTKASTMMHDLVPDDFLNESFFVPSVEEQQKIGDYLTRLDTLITLHQRKLQLLTNLKKSLIEKLFIISRRQFDDV